MSRAPGIFLAFLALLTGGGLAALNLDWSWLDGVAQLRDRSAGAVAQEPQHLAGAGLPASLSRLSSTVAGRPDETARSDAAKVASFDIARIEANGTSVFAGRAAPNSEVTVLANGQPVASTRANENGEWSAFTERRIAAGQTEIALRAKSSDGDTALAGQSLNLDVLPGRDRQASTTPAQLKPPLVRLASLKEVGTLTGSVPGPIMFSFREATMTGEGRQAADALTRHLLNLKPGVVTLSGHADERGGDEFNLQLSRERLDVVARHLRKAGYTGRLVLKPMGKAEPFAGVDRVGTARELVYQLDRRVELRAVQ